MLNAIAQLGQDRIGNVARILRDEVNTNPLRADEFDCLLDLIDQGARGPIEQQVRFIKEKCNTGPVRIANFGQFLKKLGQQPKQHQRIKIRRMNEPCRVEDIDPPAPVFINGQEVRKRQGRLTEEMAKTFALKA